MKRTHELNRCPSWTLLFVALSLVFLPACGRYMKLDGSISRVRVVETGSPRNVLVVEFDVTNNASIPYVVKEAELEIPVDGGPQKGGTIAV